MPPSNRADSGDAYVEDPAPVAALIDMSQAPPEHDPSAIVALAYRTTVHDSNLHTLTIAMITVSAIGLLLVLTDRAITSRRP
jgi:hypothetical protein